MIFDKVLLVVLDSPLERVGIIEHGLAEIVGDVHSTGVPRSVFKVDKDHFGGILQRGQNVILLGVIVSEYDLRVSGDEFVEVLLAAREQEGLIKICQNL
jgi:hypothetical protein